MEAVMEQLANFVTYITDSNVWGRILIAAVVVLVVAVLCHLAIKAIQRIACA